MASYVQVANMAAIKIGTEARITAPDDDRPVARVLAAAWDIQRRAAIRDGSWNFAMARAALPALADAPTFGWSAAFALPADFVRLIELGPERSRDAYQIEGRQILAATSGPLELRYLRDVTEAGLWDDDFAEAFACRLAWKCGKRIAGSNYSEDAGWQEYQAAIAGAKRVDALENPPIDQEESSWILARGGWDGYRGSDPARWG